MMFQWKNIQLSSEDYQNYVNNEDQAQMKINNSNITEIQWSSLYRKIQQRSLNNKIIKKSVLAYENSIKKLLAVTKNTMAAKQLLTMYGKHNNELKLQLMEIYDQLGLLHLKNISTTVQFSISRLLSLQEQLIKAIYLKQKTVEELQQANNGLQLAKNSLYCVSCHEQMQKNRNKFMIKQIMAVRQSSSELQEMQAKVLTEPEKIQKKLKEQQKHEQHQYQIKRFYYLNSVQQVLRNRDKTLKCNSAPLQNLLSEYLTQILQMLQGNKFAFTQKNLKEYDHVNRSYQSLDDMKSLINTQQFYKNVSLLIEKPYQNLVQNIQKFVNKSQIKNKPKTTVQTQTVYLTQFNQIAILQKRVKELKNQLEVLKQSKNKNQNDLLVNLQALHKIQIKHMETVHRNKNLQADNKKQQNIINELKSQILFLQRNHKLQQSKMIDTNLTEKAILHRQIKMLQCKIQKNPPLMLTFKEEKQIQTDVCQEKQKMFKEMPSTDRSHKRNIQKRFDRKQNKKISLKLQQFKMIKSSQTQLRKQSPQNRQTSEQTILRSRDNQLLDVNKMKPNDIFKKSLKIFTINPLSQGNSGQFIHRMSKKSTTKINDSIFKTQAQSALRIQTPLNSRRGIKKFTDFKMRHAYHNSEQIQLNSQQNYHSKPKQQASKLSLITGTKIVRKNSVQMSSIERAQQQHQQKYFSNMHSKQQIFSKEQLFQCLESQNQKYVVTISQPNNLSKPHSQQQLLSVLLENQQSILKPRQKEQLSKLVKFSMANFQNLLKQNVFGMICDMKFDRKLNISRSNSQSQQRLCKQIQQGQPKIDVECSKIGRKCIEIFFNLQQAQKYEKKIGIWKEIDSFIMIDNNFSHQCEKIQSYFNRLKKFKPMFYQQSILFLEKPFYFCQEIQGKDYETIQITIFRQSLRSFELQKDWIKKLFRKLLRLHKLMHKNCNHIQKFLSLIGFYQS